jgi:hypothetical protein
MKVVTQSELPANGSEMTEPPIGSIIIYQNKKDIVAFTRRTDNRGKWTFTGVDVQYDWKRVQQFLTGDHATLLVVMEP